MLCPLNVIVVVVFVGGLDEEEFRSEAASVEALVPGPVNETVAIARGVLDFECPSVVDEDAPE